MTQLLPNGKQQFTDNAGRPLLGGKVYFYSVGTQTPKDTYKDAAETVLNTNPVILDARGSASIYGTGPYRQVLRDVFGVQIWDQVLPDAALAAKNQIIADLADVTDLSKGASLVGRSSVTLANVKTLISVPAANRNSTTTYCVASYFSSWSGASSFVGPKGGGSFIWDAAQKKSGHNGASVISPTVPWDGLKSTLHDFISGVGEIDPLGNGCFVREFDVLYDTYFGVTHDGSDETKIHQAALNKLVDGTAYRLAGVSKVTSLTCSANSVTLDSVGVPYFDGGGGFETIGSDKILTISGFGWTIENVVFRDTRVTVGATTPGTVGIWLERPGSVIDLDATIKSCLFTGLERAITGIGINVKVLGCLFSYGRYFIDARQVGSQDFRGWVITGSNRFHGRDFASESVAVLLTGTARTMQIQGNYFDDCGTSFKGFFDRRSIFDGNVISGAFTNGYSIDITGGSYARVSNNIMGSLGLSGGIRLSSSSSMTVFGNSIDSTRQSAIVLIGTVNSFVTNNNITNVNINNAVDGDVYDGIVIDGASNTNKIFGNTLFQVGAKGRYAVNNLGGSNYFDGNDSTGYVSGTYNQDATKTAFGNTSLEIVKPRISYAASVPTASNWRRGDIVYNSLPSAGTFLGWVCVTGGAPGVWKTFGAISA